ncbi:BQ2448_3947 [Microbotryum intermedium]|uniref:BQ2448_3947 protein n=1 Tax=Microbotryum intermedium TaxID=269621 RepID=A0A238FF20_9BASI|nr:BQ2448_3947 [Microbotryum intermedium]
MCRVWVADVTHGYVAGWVIKDEEGISTVAIDSGEAVRQVSTLELSRVNPPTFEGAEDIADLTYLNEASVVHNLRTRYINDSIYTYSGLFLVAVNPYRPLSIYTPKVVESYKNRRRDQNPPHVFAVAERAWQNMLAHRDQSQSVLVTGESGAGKTENTKKVIQYLAAIAADPLPSSSSFDLLARQAQVESRTVDAATGKKLGQLERQILEANPILEAFGNAQTVKNNNSSRFKELMTHRNRSNFDLCAQGKFVRIFFNSIGAIAGANIDWYLLEKSRVTSRSDKERSFHIFFQLLRGADSGLRQQLLLTGQSHDYAYLRGGRQDVDGMDDKQEWRLLRKALDTVGFSDDEQLRLFRIIAAILHMGNIEIGGTDQAHIVDRTQLEKVCFLLGLDETPFMNALVRPKVKAGREWVVQARSAKQVVDEIAALSKALYEKNFGAMVERINGALGRPSTKTFIGVLDIAGFEIFETNGFEQLCINLTNEKLQQFFNHHMFVLEQDEYSREEIAWEFVNFGLELQPTIDLIESNNPMGILSCLDDASIMPKASDKSFTDKMTELATQRPVSAQYTKFTPSRIEQGFTVSHYAGKVEYRTDGWLEKNRDPLNDNITSLLSNSSDTYVGELFAEYAEAEIVGGAGDMAPRSRARKGAFRTVGQRHKEQLANLMGQLKETQPHFIRCIVPNLAKAPGQIDVPLVLDQLRCNGVLEGIRIARLGYPNRLPFSEFRRRFELLAPGLIPKGFFDGGQASQTILHHLELSPESYRLGLTKVFFKAGILAELEERRDAYLSGVVTRIQATCRHFIVKRQANKILNRANAVRTIQRNARIYNELRAWPWWALFQRVRPLLAAARSDDEMRRKEEELNKTKEEAIKALQERERLEEAQRRLQEEHKRTEVALKNERLAVEDRELQLQRSKEREVKLQEALAAADVEIDTIDRQLERAMTAKTQAEQRVVELNTAYGNQNKLLETLQSEQAAWKAKEHEWASKTLVKTAEWKAIKTERQEAASKASDLQRQLVELKQDRQREQERLNASILGLTSRLAIETKASTEARQKFVALEGEMRAAKEQAVVVQNQKREVEAGVKAKEGELARISSEHAYILKKSEAATTHIRDLELRVTTLIKDLAEQTRALESSRSAEARAATDVLTLKKLLDDKSSDQQRTAEMNQIKEAEVQELRLQVSKTANELRALQRESATDLARLRQDTDSARKEALDLRSHKTDLEREARASASRVAELEARTADLEHAQQAHDLEIELMRTKAAESMLKEREKWERDLASAQSRCTEAEEASVVAQRETGSARREVAQLQQALEMMRKEQETQTTLRRKLEDQIEQQHVVLADLDKINGDLRSELAATHARLVVAEEKAGRTVVEHIRVLEEAQRLQNLDMDRMRADREKRDAYVRTLERARATLTQTVEDMQHEREMERRQAWANKPVRDTSADRLKDEYESEKKLRELAELNVVSQLESVCASFPLFLTCRTPLLQTRLRSEISQQQTLLTTTLKENAELKRQNTKMEREMTIISASDHAEKLVYPSVRNDRPRSMQESRLANVLPSSGTTPTLSAYQRGMGTANISSSPTTVGIDSLYKPSSLSHSTTAPALRSSTSTAGWNGGASTRRRNYE